MYKETLELIKENNKGIVLIIGLIIGGISAWGILLESHNSQVASLEQEIKLLERKTTEKQFSMSYDKESLRVGYFAKKGISLDDCISTSEQVFNELNFKEIEIIDGSKVFAIKNQKLATVKCPSKIDTGDHSIVLLAVASNTKQETFNSGLRVYERMKESFESLETDDYAYRTATVSKSIHSRDECVVLTKQLFEKDDILIIKKFSDYIIEGKKDNIRFLFSCGVKKNLLLATSRFKISNSELTSNLMNRYKNLNLAK